MNATGLPNPRSILRERYELGHHVQITFIDAVSVIRDAATDEQCTELERELEAARLWALGVLARFTTAVIPYMDLQRQQHRCPPYMWQPNPLNPRLLETTAPYDACQVSTSGLLTPYDEFGSPLTVDIIVPKNREWEWNARSAVLLQAAMSTSTARFALPDPRDILAVKS